MTYLKFPLSDQQGLASESWSSKKKKLGFPGVEDALYFNIYLIVIPKDYIADSIYSLIRQQNLGPNIPVFVPLGFLNSEEFGDWKGLSLSQTQMI